MSKQRQKVLLIGGTGTISQSVGQLLSQRDDIDLYVINRGHKAVAYKAEVICGDANDPVFMADVVSRCDFDIVCNFVIYQPDQADQQVKLFAGHIRQYVFISTVVVYNHEEAVMIDEHQPLGNPYSAYGRSKAACEQVFRQAYSQQQFPVTIIRPSQTYGFDRIPLSVKGNSCYSVISRIATGRPVIVHGDGKSCWHCTHNTDFAYNFVQLLGLPAAIGQTYQLVNPQIVNWDIIYNYLYKQLHQTPQIVHIPTDLLALSCQYDNAGSIRGDKQYSNILSTAKISQTIPDFKNEIDIYHGLDRYLQDLANNPQWQKSDEAFDGWCDRMIDLYQDYAAAIKKEEL